jgi:glycosyltransferase involved in cell wall biosynthesis
MFLISVIITTFGGSLSLSRAIISVLNQTYSNFEIIVVDDNNDMSIERKKTEESMSQFKSFKNIKYIKHRNNLGGAGARNTGIHFAKGDFVAFLDDDDMYLSHRFENAIKAFERNNDIIGVCQEVVFSEYRKLTDISKSFKGETYLESNNLFVNQMYLGTGSNIFLKTEIVRSIMGFDVSFKRFQDLEFMIRVLKKGRVLIQENPLIIKEGNSGRIPNCENVKNSLNYFLFKFKDEISFLSDESQKEMLFNRYYYIFELSLVNEDINEFRKMVKKLKLSPMKSYLSFFTSKIKNYIKRNLSKKVFLKLENKKSLRKEEKLKKKLGDKTFESIKSEYEFLNKS